MKYRYYDIKHGLRKTKTKLAIAVSTLAIGVGGVVGALALFGSAHAVTPSDSLFGAATIVSGGNPGYAAQMVSDVSNVSTPYGGIDYTVPSGLTFAGLSNLSTDYKITTGDCGGGSPRFQLNTPSGNIFVYIGPAPNYAGCTPNTWENSGNLVGGSYTVDTSQLGGTFYDTYSNALATYGSASITGIQLVADGGWAVSGGVQTVLADNTQINSDFYDYTPPPVTVTIVKYLNGVQATATNANSTSFSMHSSWSADNIGSGSGSYSLSPTGFNNPNAYQATTSLMTAGASYSTNEVTGSTVATNCTLGGAPYKLVGYSTGTSLAAAETATKSTTTPSLTNIQQDQYIIVWNQACATGTITSPTAGQHVNGVLALHATYYDGDVPNTDDGVQWAVRQGTCAAGTNTVLGNVDGHHDSYSWDGNTFSASFNISALPYGSYCFVFNPTDDPGQPDVRLTQTFSVDVGPPATKDQCRQDGWKTFNIPEVFRNQGQCVSYVEHHSHRVNGDDLTYSAYGLTRHAEFNMNTATNNGWFVYWDANHDWYYVKVSDVKVSGNMAYFAGEVMKSKDNHYNGNWLFAEVKAGHPNQIWGSFTSQTSAISDVTNMSNPSDGPFEITHGHLSIH